MSRAIDITDEVMHGIWCHDLEKRRDEWLRRGWGRLVQHSFNMLKRRHEIQFFGRAAAHKDGTPMGYGETYHEALKDALEKLDGLKTKKRSKR